MISPEIYALIQETLLFNPQEKQLLFAQLSNATENQVGMLRAVLLFVRQLENDVKKLHYIRYKDIIDTMLKKAWKEMNVIDAVADMENAESLLDFDSK